MMRKDSPMKDIIRKDIGGEGNMVVQVCSIVNSKGKNSRVDP